MNLSLRNTVGLTPKEIAMMIPKKRTALKIIDFLTKKIALANS